MNDSLLDRCAAAYECAILSQYSHQRAIAAVLERVAKELAALHYRNPRLTVPQVVQRLREAE